MKKRKQNTSRPTRMRVMLPVLMPRKWIWAAAPVCLFFLSVSVLADEAPECQRLEDINAVIRCALVRHPDGQRAALTEAQAVELESAAAQRPNPELSTRGLWGKSLGDSILNTEVNLAHTLELGGKRGARIEKALAEKDHLDASALKSKESVFIETAKAVFRVRQLAEEKKTIDEALYTFNRIQRQYRSRPRLNPEQQVSLGIFELAEADYKIKKNGIEAEIQHVAQFLELATGKKEALTTESLPRFRKQWPEVSDSALTSSLGGSELKAAQGELRVAEAELSVAQSESWPDLKVGPSFVYESQGGIASQTYGFNLSFPLPLFHANGGARAVAHRGVAKATRSFELKRTELEFERKATLDHYRRSVSNLSTTLTLPEIEKKHRNVESLFERGVISSSLVIEAHRQMFDFTKDLNEHELLALESLLRLRAFQGRLFEEKL